MSLLDGMVTNRTQSDVTAKNSNGTYNYTDLNRVESAVSTLQTALNDAGCNLNLTVKTDWPITDTPTQSDMERYRSNVSAIRAALTALSTTPAVPTSMRFLTFQGANNIEKILMDVDTLLQSLGLVLQRAGQPLFFAGYGVYPASPGEPLLAEDTQEILAEDGTELFYY